IVGKFVSFASIISTMHELEFNDPKRLTNALEIAVMLKRDLPYLPIFVCPSIIFATISGLSFMIPTNRHVLCMILANLLLLSMFIVSIMR
ncbi:hypothetical protein PENTCL1PPCAC_24772, partial [Pristionchus entomophagus]